MHILLHGNHLLVEIYDWPHQSDYKQHEATKQKEKMHNLIYEDSQLPSRKSNGGIVADEIGMKLYGGLYERNRRPYWIDCHVHLRKKE